MPWSRKHKLLREGAQGEAVVLELQEKFHPTDSAAAGGGYSTSKVRLAMRFPDGELQEFEKEEFSGDLPLLIQGGDRLPVRYDPDDHSRLEIDTPAIKAARKAETEQRRQDGLARAQVELAGETAAPAAGTWDAVKARALEQPGGAAAISGLAQQLAELARLHASGALTDAEFAAAKQRVLSR